VSIPGLDQVRFRSYLDLNDDDALGYAEMMVSLSVKQMRRLSKTGVYAQEATRKLQQIARCARKLANVLDPVPDGIRLLEASLETFPQPFEPVNSYRYTQCFTKRLTLHADYFDLVAANDQLRRQIYPSRKGAPEGLYLWPTLFNIWCWPRPHAPRRRLSYAPDGPLHRFVSLVHEAYDLPRVRPSTLRDAIRAFKKETGDNYTPSGPYWPP
jgi:hypothetical protein